MWAGVSNNMMQTLARTLAIAFLLLFCLCGIMAAAANEPPQTNQDTRRLLAQLNNVRIDDDVLSTLFRIGDRRSADLIQLLDDPNREISIRAQIVIRYLGNEDGIRALRVWYGRQQGNYAVAGPIPLPLDDWDYNFIKKDLLSRPPRVWLDLGVQFIYALTLDDSLRAKSFLAQMISAANGLDETSYVGNAIQRVQTSKPKYILAGGEDLGRQVLNNAFFISAEEYKYTSARILSLNAAKDKVLVEVHIGHGRLAEEWYHVVLERCDQEWKFFSVTPVAVS
jgi:hypothetical protein